jgi:hypothetical protein
VISTLLWQQKLKSINLENYSALYYHHHSNQKTHPSYLLDKQQLNQKAFSETLTEEVSHGAELCVRS